ncbi:MAG: GAF domain-containing sensor histidine kinase [Chloroflexi bacterium]|nr:GAF domain-containing sensor histidine kinase [Chloroflexota bacterium]
MSDAALSHLRLDPLLRELLHRLRDLLSVDTIGILLLTKDEKHLRVRAAIGLEEEVAQGTVIPMGRGIAGRIAAGRTLLIAEDLSGADAAEELLRQKGIQSIMGAPLIVEGAVTGVIHVGALRPRQFTSEEAQLLQSAADRIALAIDRARLFEAERQARANAEAAQQRLALLAEISALLAVSLDHDTPHQFVANLTVPRFADWCLTYTVDETGAPRLFEVAQRDRAKWATLRAECERLPHALERWEPVARALQTRQAVLVPNVAEALGQASDRADERVTVIHRLGWISMMTVPMIRQDRVLGAFLFAMGDSARRHCVHDLTLAEDLARRAAVAVDNARLYRQAQEAAQARNTLVSTIAHDLRTPLTSIKGYSRLLLHPPSELLAKDPNWRSETLGRIDRQADRMVRLMDELVDVSRLQSGHRLDLDRAPSDLVSLVRPIIAEFQETTRRRELRLHTREATLVGEWDAARLERVVENLLGNAIKYSPDGGEW